MRNRIHKTPQREKKKFSLRAPHFLFIFTFFFTLVGLLFVFEASSIRAISETGDSFHYLKLQMRWFGLGLLAMTFFSIYPYKKLYYLSIPLMGVVFLLLVAVLIPGIGHRVNGAQGWIDLGFFNLQPTEFAKFALIVYLASWFSTKEKKQFLPFMVLIGGLMFLIMLQPDMGSATMIFGLACLMFFLSGQQLIQLAMFIGAAVLGFIGLLFAAPYRVRRLTAFLDPSQDPLGVGYHINQIMISLSQGGLFGQGFGASRQKYLFLPEAHTDSIFAIMGEELGFIGAVVLIFCYVVLLYRLYVIYKDTSDTFGKLLVGGVFSFIGIQVMINLGGMVNIMPLTGVPLPFISYGGSHMLISFMLIGIAINVAKHAKAGGR
ncbi:MAG: putative lipid II flippase FtsW [Weeksellaceae bacterium]